MKYEVKITKYLNGTRTVATFETIEEAESFLRHYEFKQSKEPRECEVEGRIDSVE